MKFTDIIKMYDREGDFLEWLRKLQLVAKMQKELELADKKKDAEEEKRRRKREREGKKTTKEELKRIKLSKNQKRKLDTDSSEDELPADTMSLHHSEEYGDCDFIGNPVTEEEKSVEDLKVNDFIVVFLHTQKSIKHFVAIVEEVTGGQEVAVSFLKKKDKIGHFWETEVPDKSVLSLGKTLPPFSPSLIWQGGPPGRCQHWPSRLIS